MRDLQMSVGRDFTTSSRYEFVIYEGERVVSRQGGFRSSAAARRAGFRAGVAAAQVPA